MFTGKRSIRIAPLAFVLPLLLVLTGCSLIPGGPRAAVNKFMEAAKAGDVDAMNKMFSQRAINRDGVEKIRSNNENFSAMSKATNSRGSYQMNNFSETQVNDNARVGFHYQNTERTDSIRMVFALSKEDGVWKIDNIGGPELEQVADITSPALKDPPATSLSPRPKPIPFEYIPPPEAPASGSPGRPISAGVLNGKATSLPQPSYPPAARAAKASGTVVVQVSVDEAGNVTEANAVSGHPLLRAAAVAAARNAKFSPTMMSGRLVKVTGVITYNFVAE